MIINTRENQDSAKRARGVTVLELLIVMTIMLMITAATIPIMMPAMQNRRMRESSRLVSTFISGARSRAIETGRPVGVVFQRFNNLPFASTLSYVEVPPPYGGENARARSSIRNSGTILANMGKIADFNPANVRIGDLIQFNYQGTRYRIAGPDANMDSVVDSPADQFTDTELALDDPGIRTPWNATPSPKLPFQIIRQPIRSALPPVQLAEGIIVDLMGSGITTGGVFPVPVSPPIEPTEWATRPPVPFDPTIVFGPNGSLEYVSVHPGVLNRPAGPVFFLIGRRELMADVSKNNPQVDENAFDPRDPRLMPTPPATPAPTFAYLENFWVSVSPQTGLVSVSEMARNPQLTNSPAAIGDARTFAIQGQAVGGR